MKPSGRCPPPASGSCRAAAKPVEGRGRRRVGHCVSHSVAGRVPKTRGLDLPTANVQTDVQGAVEVNAYLQSVSNPRVYATGDAALPPGSLPLSPVAVHEGLIVASNLLHGNLKTPDFRGTRASC